MTAGQDAQELWRRHTPRVLAALLRRGERLEDCEDATQEAFVAAARQWPVEGVPDDPVAWLVRVASRRLIDAARADTARRAREERAAAHPTPPVHEGPAPGEDTLALMVLCAHPCLTPASRVALTLRAVAGLSTAQIADLFLVPEATMAARIGRAKAAIREAGARFATPGPAERPARLQHVRDVIHLIFTGAHSPPTGAGPLDVDGALEAIRLARMLHTLAPDEAENAGLLALLLLTHARSDARVDSRGDLVPLAEQDRRRWDGAAIAEGIALLERTLPRGPVGPAQLQAAIAAVHAEAPSAAQTDWRQIVALYRLLAERDPSCVVRLNLAVAVGMAHGPAAGLAALEPLESDPQLRRGHRLLAARAHLLERAGRFRDAEAAYRQAAARTLSIPEQRYLNHRAAHLAAALPVRQQRDRTAGER